jgi:hypothetical protein
MQLEELPINKGEWLIDALKRQGYKNIPSNIVLDKTLTGIGATYTEIKAKRNSIIIEPNVPVIIGKTKKHKNLLGVWDACTKTQVKKYLTNDEIKYKKFITTPEGFAKIRSVAKKENIDIYADYFCLFDECEKITQDTGYRKNISNPVYDIFKFENKAFVSATPLKIRHDEIKRQGFRILKVIPNFDYTQKLKLIVTNNFNSELEYRLKEFKDSKCVCIFFSTTKGVNRIINNTIKSDYKVFCSDKSVRQLKNRSFKDASSSFELPLAKYNFFTSRFYSALDIELDVRPDIIILTDIYEAEHSVIDPFTEAIQIQGRFRNIIEGKRFNSLTHITNIKKDLLGRKEESIAKEIDEYRKFHEDLQNRLMQEEDVHRRCAIQKMKESSPYNRLLDDRGEINNFAIDNWYNEERVNRHYTSRQDLDKAYKDTGFFDVFMINSIRNHDENDSYTIRKKKSAKAVIEQIVYILQKQPDKGAIESIRELIREDVGYAQLSKRNTFDSDIVIDAYLALGSTVFELTNCSFKKIQKKLATHETNEKRKSPEVVAEILSQFQLGERIEKNLIKKKLQDIYSKYGITQRITHDTIKDYYVASPQNKDRPATYILKSAK